MTRLSSFARRSGLDGLVVLAAIAGAIQVALSDDAALAPRVSAWIAVPAISILVLTLLGRRRFPFAAPASFFLLAAALTFADGRLIVFSTTTFVAGLAAAVLLGNVRDSVQARLGLLFVIGSGVIIVANDPNNDPAETIFIPVLFGICWLVGYTLRERVDQADAAEQRATEAERQREIAARIAVAEERTRIAQELHDVVAHNVSLIVVQAQALGATNDDEQVIDATEGIADLGRQTMAEMHRTLRLLRANDEAPAFSPQPGLDDLDALVERSRAAGLPVEVAFEGTPRRLAQSVDLSAFRIVQEALTNVVKHAGCASTEVTIAYGPNALELTVADRGSGERGNGHPTVPGGHGLIGMRERVALFGGSFNAGPRPGDGFEVRASLPYDEGIA